MTPSASCPQPGRNSLGIASFRGERDRPVRIEYRFGRTLFARDVETQQQYNLQAGNFTMLPTNIASRYREYHFQAVASYWAEALRAYPAAITIESRNGSPETLVKKLREARVAKDKFGWKDASIDEQQWAEVAHRINITLNPNNKITMGPQNAKEYKAFDAVVTTKNEIFVDWHGQPDLLEQFCQTVTDRIYNPKPAFVVLGLTDAQAKDLEERYDLGFVARGDGKSWEVIF